MKARFLALVCIAAAAVAVAVLLARPWDARTASTPVSAEPNRPETSKAASTSAQTGTPATTPSNEPPPRADAYARNPPPSSSPPQSPDDPVMTPEQRAEQVAMLTAMLGRIYEDAETDVQLDADERDALIALVAEQQLRLAGMDLDPLSIEGAERFREIEAEFRRKIEQQIGLERSRKLARYQDSINARFEVEEARRLLELSSLPLTEAQRTAWIRAAIERGAYTKPPAFTAGDSWLVWLKEATARIDERDAKQLAVARGILDSRQFARYENHLSERRAAAEAALLRLEQDAGNH